MKDMNTNTNAAIYDRLKNGESIEDIMNGFADEANAAQARIEEENKAAEAAEVARMKAYAEERARNEVKRQEFVDLINSALGFCAKWYPELELSPEEDWDDEEIKPIADLFLSLLDIEALKTGTKSKKAESVKPLREKLPVKIEMQTKPVSTDDIFAEFFKGLGL